MARIEHCMQSFIRGQLYIARSPANSLDKKKPIQSWTGLSNAIILLICPVYVLKLGMKVTFFKTCMHNNNELTFMQLLFLFSLKMS